MRRFLLSPNITDVAKFHRSKLATFRVAYQLSLISSFANHKETEGQMLICNTSAVVNAMLNF